MNDSSIHKNSFNVNKKRELKKTSKKFPRKRRKTISRIPKERSCFGRWLVNLGKKITKNRLNLVVEGTENIPRDEAYVIIANHITFVDALWIFNALPEEHYNRTCALIGADLNSDYGLLGKLMTEAARAIPVDRKGTAAARSLIVAKNALEEGNNILIHPEGTRSATGRLGSFQTGAAYLGHKYNSPVLPIYIQGAYKIWPKGQRFPSFTNKETGEKHTLKIIFYPPFFGKDYADVNEMNNAMHKKFLDIQRERGI